MAEKAHSSPAKKPYRTPGIEEVKLVIEEAVLMACKTTSLSGYWGAGSSCLTDSTWCTAQGS